MNKIEQRRLERERALARREAAEGRALAIERAKHAARVAEKQRKTR